MSWNIFSPVKRVRKRGKAKDSFDAFINVIELFAPREHLREREAFYYNYKMMAAYRKPLLELLETLSLKKRLKTHPDEHARSLFLQLKKFYDPKETLPLQKALADRNLMARFRDLFLFFYGKETLSPEEIEGWLNPLMNSQSFRAGE